MQALIEGFIDRIRNAAEAGTPLRIRGGGSKDFYGGPLEGEVFDVSGYHGIVDYEPTELVITARAGTPLRELEAALRERGQMLPFEPPHFGEHATLGGCVAAGLSGPRRATAGAVRDFVLGVRLLDGEGTDLRFGGQVMKNVAGYDISRFMAGALGTLGVLLETSLKVLPRPTEEATLRLAMDDREAIEKMNRWAGQPLPISATCYIDGQLTVRLSGAASAVQAARAQLGGESVPEADAFWHSVREHTHGYFRTAAPLWRLSLPSTTPSLTEFGPALVEWGGALRWVCTHAEPQLVREAARAAGGHATLFRAASKTAPVFSPLPPPLLALHERLKAAFDPHRVFNPRRLYETL
jgi:glycolate oxidase FAD binding subunit